MPLTATDANKKENENENEEGEFTFIRLHLIHFLAAHTHTYHILHKYVFLSQFKRIVYFHNFSVFVLSV